MAAINVFMPGQEEIRHRWRLIFGAVLLVGSVVLLAMGALSLWERDQAVPPAVVPAAGTSLVIVPSQPTDGAIAFSIPRGAAEAQLRGEAAYVMPDAIWLHVGDRVFVTNDDEYAHMIFYTLVMPGKTEAMTFDEPGIEAFSSGCAAHGGMLNAFTSVIVSAG